MRWENPANDNDGSAPMLVQQHRITMPPAAAFKPSTDLLVRVESEYNAGTAAARPTKGAGRPGNDELPSWIAAPSVDVRGQQTPPGVCPPRPLPSVDIRGQQTPARVCPPRPLDELPSWIAAPSVDLRGQRTPSGVCPPRPLPSVDLRGQQTPDGVCPPRPLDELPSVELRGCQTHMTSAPPRSLDNGTPPVPQEATTYGQGHHASHPFPPQRAHIGMNARTFALPFNLRGGGRSQEHRTSGMSGLLQFAQATIELMGRDATFPAPCRPEEHQGLLRNRARVECWGGVAGQNYAAPANVAGLPSDWWCTSEGGEELMGRDATFPAPCQPEDQRWTSEGGEYLRTEQIDGTV